MSEAVLKGGPMDGRTMVIVGFHTKIPLGMEYGWTFACGAPSYAAGKYLRDGTWEDAERGKVRPNVCALCGEYGTHNLGIGENDGRTVDE
jgi:hypothetical protein